MPFITITNNWDHHIRAMITSDQVFYEQNTVGSLVAAGGSVGLPEPVGLNIAAGGMRGNVEERSNIHTLRLEDPGWTQIDAGRKMRMSYTKSKQSYITVEFNIDQQYVRKMDRSPLSEDKNTALSVTKAGALESTNILERLGVGRQTHKMHDPTNPANMNKK
eukprot:GFUD01001802.1.p1 GENE.GFUD01001802.1~~GFUD01001802.1.p1  ORF type:complete len:162 (+),score=23.61 GFUD01001802.1:37-522(+)